MCFLFIAFFLLSSALDQLVPLASADVLFMEAAQLCSIVHSFSAVCVLEWTAYCIFIMLELNMCVCIFGPESEYVHWW